MIFKIVLVENKKPLNIQYYFNCCASKWSDSSFSEKLEIIRNSLIRYGLITDCVVMYDFDMDRSHDVNYNPYWKIYIQDRAAVWCHRFNVMQLLSLKE